MLVWSDRSTARSGRGNAHVGDTATRRLRAQRLAPVPGHDEFRRAGAWTPGRLDAAPRRGPAYLQGSPGPRAVLFKSEEHTSELQSLMRISYAVFCFNKKKH